MTRRSVAPIYALILLETLVWIMIVPLASTFADDPELASYLRIEERELEAGGRN